MKNRGQLIKLIHVAKRELAIDDDIYRMLLASTTKKESCSKMNILELEGVLKVMKAKGFKHQPKKASNKPRSNSSQTSFKRYSPKSGSSKNRQIDKIRATWIAMAKHGIVRDSSETALDAYVRRMTNRATVKNNQTEGVDHVGWLDAYQSNMVLEALKRWHRREMIKQLEESGFSVPKNDRGTGVASYEGILEAYAKMFTLQPRIEEFHAAQANKDGEQ